MAKKFLKKVPGSFFTEKFEKLLCRDDLTAFWKGQSASEEQNVDDAEQRTRAVLVLRNDADATQRVVAAATPTDPLDVVNAVAFAGGVDRRCLRNF